jgi:hypothetical protein
MITALEKAAPHEVDDILKIAIGCTVTVEEHARLSKVDDEYGWDRYRKARVIVIDTQTGERLITTDEMGTSDFGTMHAKERNVRHSAEYALFRHKAILISVNRTAAKISLYEATRYSWKISKSKAEQAEVILATLDGLIIGAFIAEKWLEATASNFSGRESVPGRFGFQGHEAPAEIASLYVGRRVPGKYRKRGAANPIKYTWST